MVFKTNCATTQTHYCIKNTMRHHTLKGVVCNGARVLDAQDSNSTLKPQEPSVLDGHQESELVKILEMGSFIRES